MWITVEDIEGEMQECIDMQWIQRIIFLLSPNVRIESSFIPYS